MKQMRRIANIILVLFGLSLLGYTLVAFYPFIFSRSVKGVITAVQKVDPAMTILSVNGSDPTPQVFSYAVGVKDEKSGEILTSSTEDRQWAVAQPGQCAEARFFPYPPWTLDKWGTYHNARLLKLTDCSH